jgi:hypothetical protein
MNASSKERARLLSCWLVLLSCSSVSSGAAPGQTRTNPEAQVLADFQSRVAQYVELHDRLEKEAPPLKKTKDPAEIRASQEGLAAKIQKAREGARQGEIFTPEVRRAFRRLMYPEMKGPDGRDTRESLKEDAPKGVRMKVNAKYPDDAPLPTVPPNLLAALPKLPEELEYRFIDRHLILRDVHADIIVDYIPNALQ